MASIIDSLRETYGDNMSFFKILVFAAPIYFAYDMSTKQPVDYNTIIWILGVTLFFLFGFFVRTTSNVVNERDSVMPSLNPFLLAGSAIKCLLAIGPLTLFTVLLASYVIPFINVVQWFDITMKTIIWLLVVSSSLTAFLMYAKNEKIKDAYNLKTISDKAGDFIVGILFFVIQIILINIPFVGLLGYAINILFGVGPIMYAFGAYVIVFNVVMAAHYMAQLEYEFIGAEKNKKNNAM